MHTRKNIKNGFWFSLGFGFAILAVTTGCFYLTESGLSLLVSKGENEVNENTSISHKEGEVALRNPNEEPEVALRIKGLEEALAVVEKTIIADALEIPPALCLQLPTISRALKELLDREAPYVVCDDFKEDCFTLRTQIEVSKGQIMLVIHEHPVFTSADPKQQTVEPQRVEMKTNLMLSYRHLEDASMRIGKAIQAFDGGKSVYPR